MSDYPEHRIRDAVKAYREWCTHYGPLPVPGWPWVAGATPPEKHKFIPEYMNCNVYLGMLKEDGWLDENTAIKSAVNIPGAATTKH